MRERALLLGGTLRVDRGGNGIGTTVLACVPVTAPGADSGGTASGGALAGTTLDIPALTAGGSGNLVIDADAGQAQAAKQLQNPLQSQLRTVGAQSPAANTDRNTAPLMRVKHPSADGHTRF
jgi:hypothetical protein